jgi:homogentisate 1,2-dioxygenase
MQTWLYRVTSSLEHTEFLPYPSPQDSKSGDEHSKLHLSPNVLHWDDFALPSGKDWISSQRVLVQSGDPTTKSGLAYLIYGATEDMAPQTVFYSSDGDYLIIPQSGTLDIHTELGKLLVRPNEIVVIPRGIRYRVTLPDGPARGYICLLYQGHFQLPELGPIGSSCLASARDFQVPAASFEGTVKDGVAICDPSKWTVLTQFAGQFFSCEQNHSPFDVVAWQGTYYPYKYDLSRFCILGSTSFDHPDPSLGTLLTVPSNREPGTAVVDFAVFPPRWNVMEDTYWPPYYHRNTMTEFVGIVLTDQDGPMLKKDLKFEPFAALLVPPMAPHGSDEDEFEEARRKVLKPEKANNFGFTPFVFESERMVGVAPWAMKEAFRMTSTFKHQNERPTL